MTEQTVDIEDGNYNNCNMLECINDKLEEINKKYNTNFEVCFNEISGTSVIKNTSNFSVCFNNKYKYPSLGYHLGFRKSRYSGDSFYYSESIVNVIGDNYIFLKINNYGNCYQTNRPKKYITKIVLDECKNSMCINQDVKSVYNFKKPRRIKNLYYKIVDKYGEKINFNKVNFSFTLLLEYY